MDTKMIAQEILKQFGGQRSLYMIGAKHVCSLSEGGVQMKHMKTTIDNKASNFFKITLNSMDLYDLEFGYVHGVNYTIRKTVENVYAEDLVRIFEDTTKLYLRM